MNLCWVSNLLGSESLLWLSEMCSFLPFTDISEVESEIMTGASKVIPLIYLEGY